MKKNFIIVLFTLLLISSALAASDLDETLQALSEDASRGYINPMVSAFGSDMNSGWFHKAPAPLKSKWDFEVGIVAMGSLLGDDKTFDVTGQFRFNRDQAERLTEGVDADYREAVINAIMARDYTLQVSGPTVIGEAYDDMGTADETDDLNDIRVFFPGDNIQIGDDEFNIPSQTVHIPFGGLLSDLPALPLAAPQLTIGTVYGTTASFRYLPDMETIPEIGKVGYMGYGIQHNPAVWFNAKLPVDVALAFFTQTLQVGTIMEASATTYGINIAKTYGAKLVYVTPYLGLAAESSQMKFKYDYVTGSTTPDVPETLNIDFAVDGKNTAKLTAGLSFRLAILNFNFDYSFAKYPSATAGMMLNFSW